MNRDPVEAARAGHPRHFRPMTRRRDDPPKLPSRPAAEDGVRPTSKHRRHPPPVDRDLPISHRVNPSVHDAKLTAIDPGFNRPSPDASVPQLPPRDEPMLPLGQLPDHAIHPLPAPHPSPPPFRRLRHERCFFRPSDGKRSARHFPQRWCPVPAHTWRAQPHISPPPSQISPQCLSTEPGKKEGPSPPLPPLALIPSSEGGCLLLTPRGLKTPGSRAVCVGSNGETALVRARALAQPYHRGRSRRTYGEPHRSSLRNRRYRGWRDAAPLRSSGRPGRAGRCRRGRSGRAANRRSAPP